MEEPKHPVRTVDRAFEIIEIVQELDGAGVSEVAERVDIGKSAVHNHLNTLVNKEYLSKRGDEYHIGLSFLGLGAYARNRTEIYNAARHEVNKLADETGELANLLIEQNGTGIYLYQARGKNAVELDTHGMPAMIDRTITDREEFFDELGRIRERKYATDREKRLMGLCCVAAPITDDQDRSIEAISVACPLHRVGDERFHEDLPNSVLGTVNVIELEYNYS